MAIPFYWRLSSFYLCYFGLLGALVPYWALYLRDVGFSAVEIGLLLAMPQLTKVGAPNLWSWFADRSGRRLGVIRLGNLLAAIIFIGVFFVQNFWSMMLVLAGFSFFWNAVLAQFEVITLETLGARSNSYSLVRLWGSVGFIVVVLSMGLVLDQTSVAIVPYVLLGLLWAIWLCTLMLPERAAPFRRGRGHLMDTLKRPDVLAFFLCAFLMQMSHGPYYTFYTIYLVDAGISRAVAGQLWAAGVIAEVLLFLAMHQILARWHPGHIMLISLLLAALRWLLIGWMPDWMPALVFAQMLHAASFGSFHAASMAWLHGTFTGRSAGQGQALYSSVGFGAGWAVGATLSGVLWDRWHGSSFIFASLVALVAALIALKFLGMPHDEKKVA